jgi:hypothetical protein
LPILLPIRKQPMTYRPQIYPVRDPGISNGVNAEKTRNEFCIIKEVKI